MFDLFIFLFFWIVSWESVFVYVVLLVGVVYEVMCVCSWGELSDCICDLNCKGRSWKGFEWGGCSDNVVYGLRFVKLFVDFWE